MRVPSYSQAIGMRAQSDTVRKVEYKILQTKKLKDKNMRCTAEPLD